MAGSGPCVGHRLPTVPPPLYRSGRATGVRGHARPGCSSAPRPSLAAYADCPRRYRYSYDHRPAPPKGPPWARASLGASLHIALRNWYALPAERRRPEVVATLLKGGWVRDGYRDPQQEEAAFRAARGWLEAYVATQASARSRSGSSGWWRSRPRCWP